MYIIVSRIELCFAIDHLLDIAAMTDYVDHLNENAGIDGALVHIDERLCAAKRSDLFADLPDNSDTR